MAPDLNPPRLYSGVPHRFVLAAGSRLTRVHDTRFDVTEFNPTLARNRYQGGRFDATPADEYSYLYAAQDDSTAVSEALLRDLPMDERGARLFPRVRLSRLEIGWLATTLDLELVTLRSGRDLAAVGQDSWLTTAPAADYRTTRRWASAIRTWAPWARGLTWRSLREPAGYAFVFFSDRCPDGSFKKVTQGLPVPSGEQDLATGPGRIYIEEILITYRVALM